MQKIIAIYNETTYFPEETATKNFPWCLWYKLTNRSNLHTKITKALINLHQTFGDHEISSGLIIDFRWMTETVCQSFNF